MSVFPSARADTQGTGKARYGHVDVEKGEQVGPADRENRLRSKCTNKMEFYLTVSAIDATI